ncbi:hypothetical protein [Pseudidiomarina mangrovi]|uniref:hypothetical protein n=1 Tax=Pseudidiomarina mangrovi TaxID=2487133 RepID=UPI000FCB4C24|nr:hypothetical protein [Pseudidiomarina mangrovi]CAI8163848.1 MAG: Uncharacterised protein [Pseudidiomarina mangrovi]
MNRSTTVWTAAMVLIGAVTVASMSQQVTAADADKYLQGSYAVTAQTDMKISFGVGSIELSHHDGDEVLVEIKATASDGGFWRSEGDVSKVELLASQQGNWLELEVPEQDNVQLEWQVKLPRLSSIDLELGIGEIKGRIESSDLDIDLGIGDIKLTLIGDVKSINMDVGVGDTKITGANHSSSERAIVTSSSSAQGNGQARINIDAGIGDVHLTIEK